jgi:N-acetylmuramoyl-L-alanine amidase CwlA
MEIIQMLIPENVKPKYTVNGKKVTFKMVPEYITIHETANTAKGANDLAHANLQKNGNSRQASWHLQVDEDSCYQSLPFDEAGIHTGDGAYGDGNRKSIGMEICVNSDGDYEKSIRNAANIVAQLMKQFNIPLNKIVPHKHWSGKNCPTKLLPRWQEFINLCKEERGKLEVKVSSEKPVSPFAKEAHEWAMEYKISDGSRPHDNITRQEALVILKRQHDHTLKEVKKLLEQK